MGPLPKEKLLGQRLVWFPTDTSLFVYTAKAPSYFLQSPFQTFCTFVSLLFCSDALPACMTKWFLWGVFVHIVIAFLCYVALLVYSWFQWSQGWQETHLDLLSATHVHFFSTVWECPLSSSQWKLLTSACMTFSPDSRCTRSKVYEKEMMIVLVSLLVTPVCLLPRTILWRKNMQIF